MGQTIILRLGNAYDNNSNNNINVVNSVRLARVRGGGFAVGRAYYPKNGGDGGGVRLVSAARSVVIVVVGTSLPASPCRPVAGLHGRGASSAHPPCHGYAGPAGQLARPRGHAHRTRRPVLLAGRLSCSFTPPSPLSARTSLSLSLSRARALTIYCCYFYYYYSFHDALLSAAPSPQHLSFNAAATAQPSLFHKHV